MRRARLDPTTGSGPVARRSRPWGRQRRARPASTPTIRGAARLSPPGAAGTDRSRPYAERRRRDLEASARWCGTASASLGATGRPPPAAAGLADRPYVTVRDRHSPPAGRRRRGAAGRGGRPTRPCSSTGSCRRLAGRAARPPAGGRRLPACGSSVLVVQGCDLAPAPRRRGGGLARRRATRPVPPRSWSRDGTLPGRRPRRRRPRAGLDRPGRPPRRRVTSAAGWRLPAGAAVEDLGPPWPGRLLRRHVAPRRHHRPRLRPALPAAELIDDRKLDGFVDVTGLQHRVVTPPGFAAALDRAVAERQPGLRPALQARIDGTSTGRRPGPAGPGPDRRSGPTLRSILRRARPAGPPPWRGRHLRAALARAGGEADTVRAPRAGPGRTGRRPTGGPERPSGSSAPPGHDDLGLLAPPGSSTPLRGASSTG